MELCIHISGLFFLNIYWIYFLKYILDLFMIFFNEKKRFVRVVLELATKCHNLD